MRILDAMVHAVSDHGVQSVSVARVTSLARVSRKTFYVLFESCDDCLIAALEHAAAFAQTRVAAAYNTQTRWLDSVRAGLLALLHCFDEQPELARLCVVEAPAAGPEALLYRGVMLDRVAWVIDEGGRAAGGATPSPFTAQGMVGGVLSVIHMRLLRARPKPLIDLLNPLMGFIVLPYLGRAAVRRELSRPPPQRSAAPANQRGARGPLDGPDLRLTHRTLGVLGVIAGQPGLSNRQVGERAGIRDDAQTSKMLTRLARHGLMENTGGGQPAGAANAWRLTPNGEQLERAFRRDARLPRPDGRTECRR